MSHVWFFEQRNWNNYRLQSVTSWNEYGFITAGICLYCNLIKFYCFDETLMIEVVKHTVFGYGEWLIIFTCNEIDIWMHRIELEIILRRWNMQSSWFSSRKTCTLNLEAHHDLVHSILTLKSFMHFLWFGIFAFRITFGVESKHMFITDVHQLPMLQCTVHEIYVSMWNMMNDVNNLLRQLNRIPLLNTVPKTFDE